MAHPTTEHEHPAPKQAHTAGVVQQGTGKSPPAPTARALDPVLAEGIDPVVLHRLYPDADSIADAGALALAQGKKTMEEGAKLEADQQASQAKPEAVKP